MSAKSGIVKAHRAPNNFFQGHVKPMIDPSLTYGAKGLLAYLMTKPDEWECRNYDLYNHSADSRYAVNKIIKELSEAGYIHREKKSKGRGGIQWVTHVYELPELNPYYDVRYTNVDNTNVDNTNVDNTNVDTRTYSNNKNSNNNYSKNNNSNSQPASQPQPLVDHQINKRTLAAAAANELLDLFSSVGISKRKQNELITKEWVTPAYVAAHIERAKAEGVQTGLLVTRLMDGDPIQEKESDNLPCGHHRQYKSGNSCLKCLGVVLS